MDEELARHLVKTAFKSASDLTVLYQMINEFCDDEDIKESLKKPLLKIITELGTEFNNQITDEYPQIQEEIDNSIKKYGILIR